MSLVIDIADAVTAELNSAPQGTFNPALVVVRKVLPVYELAELTDLKVTVVPKRMAITGGTRAASQYEIAVDIGIQRKLSAPGSIDMEADVAALGTLVDQIIDYLRQRPLSAMPGVSWLNTVNEPVYAPEHLAEQRVFTSVLTVTYRAMK